MSLALGAPFVRRTNARLLSEPASFIENRGQFDSHVEFYADFGPARVWFADDGVVFDIRREKIEASSKQANGSKLNATSKVER